jgi:ABC-type siderophore export system fused ATPase/permease subunit
MRTSLNPQLRRRDLLFFLGAFGCCSSLLLLLLFGNRIVSQSDTPQARLPPLQTT